VIPACALRKRRKKYIGPEKAEEQKHLHKEKLYLRKGSRKRMCRQRTSSLQCYVEKGHRPRESRRTEEFNEKAEEQTYLNKENSLSSQWADWILIVALCCKIVIGLILGTGNVDNILHIRHKRVPIVRGGAIHTSSDRCLRRRSLRRGGRNCCSPATARRYMSYRCICLSRFRILTALHEAVNV
jgi:hypothetical protein